MATTEQSYSRVAKAVVGDVRATTKGTADELFPKGGPGAQSTTRAATIQHVRDLWPYPEMRAALFQRMVPAVQGPDGQMYPAKNGLENWENLVREAWPMGYPEPVPVAPDVMGGGFSPTGVPY